MLYVNVNAARGLANQRLFEEVGMCQHLGKALDEELGAYMTILGRMAVLNIMQRFRDLPEEHRPKVFNKWASEMHWYGPWTLVRDKLGKGATYKLPEETNLAYFLDQDTSHVDQHNRLLDSGFPWGVLTLGGLMRAYAECSEMIFDELKSVLTDSTTLNEQQTAWEKQRIMENEGRWSWQRNLIRMYGYDLFKKEQTQQFGLTSEEKLLPKQRQLEILAEKLRIAQEKLAQIEGDIAPTKDRMRYVRELKDVQSAATWLAEYYQLEPSWTKGGRMKWQTYLKDRISLVGDLYGLVRGATISGTTSDHAYSFFQLCHDVNIMDKTTDPRYAILTRATRRALGVGAWSAHTDAQLRTAFDVMQTDQGFGLVVRMMMLIPIIQMGIEMHHSVHEMASVIGLNDLINWRIGYYESLYMTLEELRRLENSVLREARAKKGITTPSASNPFITTSPLQSLENKIKAILKDATDNVFPCYFVTLDPYVVDLAGTDFGGVVLKSERHRHAHKQKAVMDQTRMTDLNRAVTSTGTIGAEGVDKAYIQTMMSGFTLSDSPTLLADVDSVYDEMLGRTNVRQYKAKLHTLDGIRTEDRQIWVRYKAAYMV